MPRITAPPYGGSISTVIYQPTDRPSSLRRAERRRTAGAVLTGIFVFTGGPEPAGAALTRVGEMEPPDLNGRYHTDWPIATTCGCRNARSALYSSNNFCK